MKRFIASILMMLAVGIIMQGSANAEVRVFIANLSGANEVPAVSNAEAGITGTGTFVLDVTRDASNNITAATARFETQLAGFSSSVNIILTHIHEGAAGVNGPVRIDSGLTPAN